jgi:hypothetical protein
VEIENGENPVDVSTRAGIMLNKSTPLEKFNAKHAPN